MPLITTQSVEVDSDLPNMMKILKSGELESYQHQLRQSGLESVYDWNDAFDCINTVQAIKELGIGQSDRIINLGAYHDTSLQMLDNLGYQKLYGIDKNADIYNDANYNRIRYSWGNIESTHLPKSFFDCAVCLSVIEHGVGQDKFLAETHRILKPGSPLIISTDFYPEKISLTTANRIGQKLGRWSWNIFSKDELLDFIDSARRKGFVPLFDVDKLRSYQNRDAPIKHLGVHYTFAFMVFQAEHDSPRGGGRHFGVSILLPCQPTEQGGISIYSNLLLRRFSEAGIESELTYSPAQTNYSKVLIEAAHGLSRSRELPAIIGELRCLGKEVYTEYHDSILDSREFKQYVARNSVLICKASEIAEYDGVDDYVIAPHASYNLQIKDKATEQICLGTFGFGFRSKRIEEVIKLAKKLDVKAKIVTSIVNTETITDQTEVAVGKLRKLSTDKIKVLSGQMVSEGRLIEEMSECSHFIFAHMSTLSASGTMTFAKSFHKPIIALNSFQAKQAQAIRVPIFASRTGLLRDQTLQFVMGLLVRWHTIHVLLLEVLSAMHARPITSAYLNHFAKQPKMNFRAFLYEIVKIMRAKPVTKKYLEDLAKRRATSRDDDGFDYLLNILEFAQTPRLTPSVT